MNGLNGSITRHSDYIWLFFPISAAPHCFALLFFDLSRWQQFNSGVIFAFALAALFMFALATRPECQKLRKEHRNTKMLERANNILKTFELRGWIAPDWSVKVSDTDIEFSYTQIDAQVDMTFGPKVFKGYNTIIKRNFK